ncbi:MAG TPA: YCF48-related protein, partial [Flavobacteriaceae bacterium]|nr:YCF48-related protein [Flavobacteriaceae bacterium]
MKQFFTFLIFIFTITFVHSQGQINFPGEGTYGSICPFGEDLVYLMVDDGMFYTSNDGGLNWTENNIGISEDFFDMVFFDEELGFAVGSNGTIVKTMDSGQNWSIVPSGTTENLFSI